MSNERNNQILAELSKPFHPSHITWRPGALTGKKDKALALAYADVRAYQNRLDEVCGMDWSVSYREGESAPEWGHRSALPLFSLTSPIPCAMRTMILAPLIC